MLRIVYWIATFILFSIMAILAVIMLVVGFEEFDRLTEQQPLQTIVLLVGGIAVCIVIGVNIAERLNRRE